MAKLRGHQLTSTCRKQNFLSQKIPISGFFSVSHGPRAWTGLVHSRIPPKTKFLAQKFLFTACRRHLRPSEFRQLISRAATTYLDMFWGLCTRIGTILWDFYAFPDRFPGFLYVPLTWTGLVHSRIPAQNRGKSIEIPQNGPYASTEAPQHV